jgi:hypothetical protein
MWEQAEAWCGDGSKGRSLLLREEEDGGDRWLDCEKGVNEQRPSRIPFLWGRRGGWLFSVLRGCAFQAHHLPPPFCSASPMPAFNPHHGRVR